METKITFGSIWQQDHSGTFNWLVAETVALMLGATAVYMLVWERIEVAILVFYGVATAASIFAGYDIANRVAPRIMARRDMVKLLNDRVHKWSVVALNGMVFGAVLYRLMTDTRLPHDRRMGTLAVLGIFAAVYAGSYLFRVVRAHSVIARFRSAVLRATLVVVMANLIWGRTGRSLASLLCFFALWFTFWHLLKERDRWGWDIR